MKKIFDGGIGVSLRNLIEGLIKLPDIKVSLLGTKEENGTDYAFICYNTVENVIQVVTVHEAMNGNTEIQNICTIDTALFMK